MKILRVLLVLCLSLSVPTTALATVVGTTRCPPLQADKAPCSHCNSGHCASGSAAALIAGEPGVETLKTETPSISFQASRTAAGHSLGLFRPPCLT